MVELLQLLVLEEILSRIDQRGLTYDRVIGAMMPLSEARQYLLYLRTMKEVSLLKRVHGTPENH